jgi:hypothetical protein
MASFISLIGLSLFSASCTKKNALPDDNTILDITTKPTELLNDNFDNATLNWNEIKISGGGSFLFSNGKMTVTANSNGIYGVYNKTILSGHFYVEVNFSEDAHTALALFKAKTDGTADIDNYTMIKVDNVNGKIVVSVTDRQNGQADVLDNTAQSDKSKRYKNILGENTYSVPWTGTNKKLRILHHINEKFFHFYYQVTKSGKGSSATGWAELAPSKEWSQLNDNFYAGLVAFDGKATFDNVISWSEPTVDIDDSNTGFAVTFREFNWSGYFGDALVVTFNKTAAPLTEGKRKFVFWKEANYIPCWYLDNNLLYSNEFVETWGGGFPGCHEPMSDRILLFSKVTLDENTASRKVVHWHYILSNPDYNIPDDGSGSQVPEVDEFYYIYPDATVIRKIQYKPKLDTEFRNWHELTELIVISGNSTKAADHLSNPALSIWPVNGVEEEYYPMGGSNYDESKNDATILAAHFNNHPDVFNVFSDNASHPETYAGYPINIYKTWHSAKFAFTHWPVSKEQFWYNDEKNWNPQIWSQQVNHSSLAGAGVYGGTDWNSKYKTAPNGRKYREFISLMSLSPKGNLQFAKQKTLKWLKDPQNWE